MERGTHFPEPSRYRFPQPPVLAAPGHPTDQQTLGRHGTTPARPPPRWNARSPTLGRHGHQLVGRVKVGFHAHSLHIPTPALGGRSRPRWRTAVIRAARQEPEHHGTFPKTVSSPAKKRGFTPALTPVDHLAIRLAYGIAQGLGDVVWIACASHGLYPSSPSRGFRGINGCLPASGGSPPFIPRSP